MKTGRPISTPQRACCAAGDMLIENVMRKAELQFSRGGIIASHKLTAVEKALRYFANDIMASISSDTPAGIAVAALVRRSCVERLESAANFAARASDARQDIAVEELRCAAEPTATALTHYADEAEKGEEDEFSTF